MLIGGVVPTGGSVFSLFFFFEMDMYLSLKKRRVINIFTYTGNKLIKKKRKTVDNFRQTVRSVHS